MRSCDGGLPAVLHSCTTHVRVSWEARVLASSNIACSSASSLEVRLRCSSR